MILLPPIVIADVVVISFVELLSMAVGLVVSVIGIIVQGVDVVITEGLSSVSVLRVPSTTESNLAI